VRRVLAACAIAGAVAACAGVSLAAFSATTTNPTSSFVAKRIYTGQRTTSAWQLDDAATGTSSNKAWATAFAADSITQTTGNWTTAYTTTRYVDVDFNNPLPAGLSISGATLNVTFAESGGGTTCYYFEMRTASSGAVIGTHGGTGSDIGCSSSTTLATVSTSIPEVATSDSGNDLRVRIYAKNTTSKALTLDRVTVTGSTYAAFTLYGNLLTDASTAVPTTTNWGLASADTLNLYTTGNWSTAFASTRLIKFTFPAYIPTGAVITAATFEVSYRPNTATNTACEYFEVYNSTTLLATHGNSTTPVSCNSSNITFQTDTVSIPEVDTVAEANAVVVKLYAKNSGSKPIQFDSAFLKLTYYYD
jgi:hypothetical protein